MDWQYNSSVKAWTTQVAIAGKFHLTRDDTIQGQTVSEACSGGRDKCVASAVPNVN
jgi:hypothetical protein